VTQDWITVPMFFDSAITTSGSKVLLRAGDGFMAFLAGAVTRTG